MSPVQCETLGSGFIRCSCFLPPLKGRKERGLVVVWRMEQKGIAPYSWQERGKSLRFRFSNRRRFPILPRRFFGTHANEEFQYIPFRGKAFFDLYFSGKASDDASEKKGMKGPLCFILRPCRKISDTFGIWINQSDSTARNSIAHIPSFPTHDDDAVAHIFPPAWGKTALRRENKSLLRNALKNIRGFPPRKINKSLANC